MNKLRVSIVIPCFNHGAFIEEALESVYAQTFSDYEIIVVDDGSSDALTLQVLKSLTGDGLKLIEQPNMGLVAARNRGIAQAAGEYILPLDADDRISPDFIRRAVVELDRDPSVGIVYGHTELFGARSGLWFQPDFAMPDLLFENMIVATALFRKADWTIAGGYRPAMVHAWEDWDFWLTLVALGRKIVRLEGVTFYYRMSPDSMTSRLSFTRTLSMMLRIVIRHRGLYLANIDAVLQRLFNPFYRKIASPRD